jgi:hypothetical protein
LFVWRFVAFFGAGRKAYSTYAGKLIATALSPVGTKSFGREKDTPKPFVYACHDGLEI